MHPRRRGSASSGPASPGGGAPSPHCEADSRAATRALIGDLIAAQGLAGRPTARLRESLEDFSITERTWLTPSGARHSAAWRAERWAASPPTSWPAG